LRLLDDRRFDIGTAMSGVDFVGLEECAGAVSTRRPHTVFGSNTPG
jgi:hypothetical protein